MCITKLFELNSNFEELRFLAGALSVGISSAIMTLTGTVHPPAGATALLAAVDSHVSGLGWLLLPIVLISSLLTTAVACLLNNMQRRYPIYWWTPPKKAALSSPPPEDAEKDEKSAPQQGSAQHPVQQHEYPDIVVSAKGVYLPRDLSLSQYEQNFLSILGQRLREAHGDDLSLQSTHSHTHSSDHEKSEKDSSSIV